MTLGDHSPGVVAQGIGGGGQLSVSGMNVLFTSIGGSNGASGDAGEVVFDNAGDVYTEGLRSHGVVVQSIGGGGGGGGGGAVDPQKEFMWGSKRWGLAAMCALLVIANFTRKQKRPPKEPLACT